MKLLILSATFLFIFISLAWGGRISVTGSWSESIDSANLQGGPGTDLTSTYQSATNQVTIDIHVLGVRAYRVDIKKVDSTWHTNLHVWVQRTGNGIGPKTISGGTTYQEVTDTYQSFFSGTGDRSKVPIQLRFTGVSLLISPDNYSTTVYYTVIDL